MTMAAIGITLLWFTGCATLLAIVYRRAVSMRWREPVLRTPVLIFESDDWGYGPLVQSRSLDRIADALAAFRDRHGRHPVATLGVVLAGPDTDRIRADGCRSYHRATLADPQLASVRDAMTRGASRGVFSLQLHAMEHFWPDCLIRAAAAATEVRAWLTGSGFPSTETLPSPLQSRWIDATTLPSSPLPREQTIAAAQDEVRTFAAIFGAPPQVAVPPTFIWTEDVEAAWSGAGVRVIVTPGVRCDRRDAEGRPVPAQSGYFNAASGPHDVSYVMRNDYFEPCLGHTHQRALDTLARNTRAGRPTLLEIHRMNFIGDDAATERALAEVTALLSSASARFPELRFMSTFELARHYRERSELVATRLGSRIHVVLRRLAEVPRLRKLAWMSGVALPLAVMYLFTARYARQESL